MEQAINRGQGQISTRALKALKKFNTEKSEKLARRIHCFSVLLKKETDVKKRRQIIRWIAGWQREGRALYRGWTRSKIHRDLQEDYPITTRAYDKSLCKFDRDNGNSGNDCRATAIINRIRKKI